MNNHFKSFVFLLFVFIVSGCMSSPSSGKIKEDTTENENNNNKILLDIEQVKQLIDVFENKDESIAIDPQLVSQLTKQEYDLVSDVSRIIAIEMLKLNNKYYFMYKIECMGGGNCARYYLLSILDQKYFISNELIGYDLDDMGEKSYLKFNLKSEFIDLFQITNKLNESADFSQVDTLYRRIEFE